METIFLSKLLLGLSADQFVAIARECADDSLSERPTLNLFIDKVVAMQSKGVHILTGLATESVDRANISSLCNSILIGALFGVNDEGIARFLRTNGYFTAEDFIL